MMVQALISVMVRQMQNVIVQSLINQCDGSIIDQCDGSSYLMVIIGDYSANSPLRWCWRLLFRLYYSCIVRTWSEYYLAKYRTLYAVHRSTVSPVLPLRVWRVLSNTMQSR